MAWQLEMTNRRVASICWGDAGSRPTIEIEAFYSDPTGAAEHKISKRIVRTLAYDGTMTLDGLKAALESKIKTNIGAAS